ncbi:hypothetical protein MRX96_050292 [Rhipicephalus microplus]
MTRFWDRAFVGEGEKGNLLDKSLELDVEEDVPEAVGCLETDSRDGDQTQGPIPAMFQPKSCGGPDGALLFKEGHLIRNGAFPAQCTSQQQSGERKKTVGDLVKEVEAQSAEDPDDGDREMSDDPDDSLLGLGDSFDILEYVDADQDRAFVGEAEKGNLLDKSLELDVEDGDLEEVRCLKTDSRDGDRTQGCCGKEEPMVKPPPVAGMPIPGPATGGALSGLPRGYWPMLLQEQLLPHEDLGKRKREQRKHSGEAAMESLLSNLDLNGSRSTCSRRPT